MNRQRYKKYLKKKSIIGEFFKIRGDWANVVLTEERETIIPLELKGEQL